MQVSNAITPETHLRVTLATAGGFLIALGVAIWNAAGWASDMEAAKTAATSAATTAATNSKTITDVVNNAGVQADTLDRQQRAIDDLIKLQRQVSESVIRIETKLEERSRVRGSGG